MNQCCLHTHNLGKEPHLNCIFRHIITSSLSHICFISLVESMGEKTSSLTGIKLLLFCTNKVISKLKT